MKQDIAIRLISVLIIYITTLTIYSQADNEFNRILTLQARPNEKFLPSIAGNDRYLAIAVMKYKSDGTTPKSQTVHIYERNINEWQFVQEIYHSEEKLYQYGLHLAFWGNWLLVSCQACESYTNPRNPKTNKFLVYQKKNIWQVVDEMDLNNTSFNSMQILSANNYLFISDPWNSFIIGNAGAVYSYYRLGDRVGSKSFMVSPHRKKNSHFGFSIAASHKDLFISESGAWSYPDSGLVYRYDLDNIQARNEPVEIIKSSNYAGRDGFGLYMTGNDSLLVISSPNHYKVKDEGTDKREILEYPHVQLYKKDKGRYTSHMIINGPKDSEYTFGINTVFDNNHLYIMRKWQVLEVYFGRYYDFSFSGSGHLYNNVFRPGGSSADTSITIFKGGNSYFAGNYSSDNTRIVLYQKTVLKPPHLTQYSIHDKFGYAEVPQIKDGIFRVTSDGSEGSMFKVEVDQADSNYILQIAENGLGEDIIAYGKFTFLRKEGKSLYFKYRHPDYFTKPFQYKDTLELELRHLIDHRVMPVGLIEVYRPPVLMVHGIWSSDDTYTDLESALLQSMKFNWFQLNKLDYSNSNAFAFANNYHLIPKYINKLKRKYQTYGIVCNKVIIVGHSMGGILTRLYLQSLSYKNDIYRFIGLNVPHGGSAMANYLIESPVLSKILNGVGRKTNQGAVDNLRVDSEIIQYVLNGRLKNNNIVPSHSIITKTIKFPMGGDPSDWPKRSVLSEILSDSRVTQIHNNEENDEVVVTSSQVGGINEEARTLIDDEVHTGATENQKIINRIIHLLDIPSESFEFSKSGFNPPKLEYTYGKETNEIELRSALNNEIPQIRLLNPADKISLEDSLAFSIQVPTTYDKLSILIVSPNGKLDIISSLKTEDTLYWKPTNKIPGFYKIYQIAYKNSNPLARIDSMDIRLHSAYNLIDLFCNETNIESLQHELTFVKIKGMADSGKTIDLTYLPELKLICNRGTVKWQNGYLVHNEPGSDTIYFEYQNLKTKEIIINTLPAETDTKIEVYKDPVCSSHRLFVGKVSGLVPPYRYLWNTGDTTASIKNVKRGYYSVLVTDRLGSESEAGYLVQTGTEIWDKKDTVINIGKYFSIPRIQNEKYFWSTKDTTSYTKIITPGKYILTITTPDGCSVTDTIHVYTTPASLVIFNHPSFNIIKQKDETWIINPKNRGYVIESLYLKDKKNYHVDEKKWMVRKDTRSVVVKNNDLNKNTFTLEVNLKRGGIIRKDRIKLEYNYH